MVRSMFGMGGTEILVILIVALLFLGPDKLPEAAKSISKGIRDIKKQSRVLQRTIEDDEHIGGAFRDLRSALRGDDEPIPPPKPKRQLAEASEGPSPEPAGTVSVQAGEPHTDAQGASEPAALEASPPDTPPTAWESASEDAGLAFVPATAVAAAATDKPSLTMPPTAGDPDGAPLVPSQDAELAALVKPAPNTVPRGAPRPSTEPQDSSEKRS
jgi:sec-independent protein translocase protein TatB